MAIDLRYAQADDYSRISTFLDRFWAKDHIYVRMPQLFEWTFGRRRVWDKEGYSFALAEDKGEIIGILGEFLSFLTALDKHRGLCGLQTI